MNESQQREMDFWSQYNIHLCEADKQEYCAAKAGIKFESYLYDLKGASMLEIGGGPQGLALRCVNGRRKVIEPLDYPEWVWGRYDYFGVECEKVGVEDMDEEGWDEVWVFNVLQHVDNLVLALAKIRNSAKVLRIFDWLNVPSDTVHKFVLTEELLDSHLGIDGYSRLIHRRFMYRTDAYYGVYSLTKGD